jgi:hypothetical protein
MRVLQAESGAKFHCHSAAKSSFGRQNSAANCSSKYIQPIEVKVFCDVRQAIFERQNKFFRCRQGGSMQIGQCPTVTGSESSTVGQNFTFLLAARFLTVHSQQCYGSDL